MPDLPKLPFSIHETDGALIVAVPRNVPAYARGAALAATLAFPPERRDDPTTWDAYRVCGRIALRYFQQDDPIWQQRLEVTIPDHLMVSVDKLDGFEPKLQRALDDAMGAAHMAAPFLQQAEAAAQGRNRGRSSPQVQASVKRALDQEADRFEALAQHGAEVPARFGTSVDNAETRVARVRLPVIHLAFATAQAIGVTQKALADRPDTERQQFGADVAGPGRELRHQWGLRELLLDDAMQQYIIDQAERLEALLPHMPRLKPKRLVQFRLV